MYIVLLVLPAALLAQDEKAGIAFSTIEPSAQLPAGWKNLPVVRGKPMTQYTLVHDGHTTVLQADANRSASALMHEGNIDLVRSPVVTWRWKVERPIEGADNRVGSNSKSLGFRVSLYPSRRATKPTQGILTSRLFRGPVTAH
ncbi:DUF3047 domain-containing protein [Caballeronia arationis]|uniref:DUF3047 domain-containing protein n=1 Tax=Caballeronia arationis TaxID=1777142 RepID=UPI0035B536F6